MSDAYPTVSILDGMRNAGLETNEDLSKLYTDYRTDRPVVAINDQDWTLPEDFTVGDNTRVEINGDKILYGEREGEYLDGFTVATYADGALSTIYEFKSGLVTSWQQFFSPDGSKLVVAWIPSADSTDWNVTLVDLATREESKLELPEMSIQTAGQEGEKDAAKAPELVMVKWKDDNNLLVTGSLKNFDDSTKPVSYLYTLPAGE